MEGTPDSEVILTQVKMRGVWRVGWTLTGVTTLSNEVAMNSTSVTSAAQVNDVDHSTRIALSVMEDHEFSSDDEFIRWCGWNELLFAVEIEGIMELSAESFL